MICPPVSNCATPRPATIRISVAMIGCMPTNAASSPFHAPANSPTPSAAASARPMRFGSSANMIAAVAPAMATMVPTEMSMPRVAITSVMPSETTISGEARFRISIGAPKKWPSSIVIDRKSCRCATSSANSNNSVTTGHSKEWRAIARNVREIMLGLPR
jgi:hypothetical protein